MHLNQTWICGCLSQGTGKLANFLTLEEFIPCSADKNVFKLWAKKKKKNWNSALVSRNGMTRRMSWCCKPLPLLGCWETANQLHLINLRSVLENSDKWEMSSWISLNLVHSHWSLRLRSRHWIFKSNYHTITLGWQIWLHYIYIYSI